MSRGKNPSQFCFEEQGLKHRIHQYVQYVQCLKNADLVLKWVSYRRKTSHMLHIADGNQ